MVDRFKPFGVDLDPDGDLEQRDLPDGDVETKFRGETLDFERAIAEIEERATNAGRGKRPARRLFSGTTFKKE